MKGVFNTITPAITKMRERKKGQILMVGSASAKAGGVSPIGQLADEKVYAGTKVGLLYFSRALRPSLARINIGVTIAMPGYIATDITET
eukprot:UN08789